MHSWRDLLSLPRHRQGKPSPRQLRIHEVGGMSPLSPQKSNPYYLSWGPGSSQGSLFYSWLKYLPRRWTPSKPSVLRGILRRKHPINRPNHTVDVLSVLGEHFSIIFFARQMSQARRYGKKDHFSREIVYFLFWQSCTYFNIFQCTANLAPLDQFFKVFRIP